jgi:hypothetical protein
LLVRGHSQANRDLAEFLPGLPLMAQNAGNIALTEDPHLA